MKSIALFNRWLVVVAMLNLAFQVGCKKDDAGETAGMFPTPQTAPPSGYEFEPPVRLMAGGEFVAVEEPGYACPTLADVDGDGKLDLVVGQFNNGHMQFCKNIAKDGELPKFVEAQWIMSGDNRAEVPGVW